MEEKEIIKKLLIEIKNSINNVIEIKKYNISDIINVALENGLYDSLMVLFKPVIINGTVSIPYDAFSTDIIERINTSQSIPKEIKDSFIRELFNIDFNLISQIKIKDSHAREISGIGWPIRSTQDVIYYAEPACLATCVDLYNKNIRTTMNDTEGVIEDPTITNGICKVHIEAKSLSPENLEVVEGLIKSGHANKFIHNEEEEISIFVNCNGDDTIGEVSQRLMALSSQFTKQDVLYGKRTIEEAYNDYYNAMCRYSSRTARCFPDGNFTIDGLIEFAKIFGEQLYYDEKEDVLWNSETLYKRHLAFLEEQGKRTPTSK